MTLNLSVDEVLTTTRSVRKRLDFDKPVSHDVLMKCLDLALQAPTGSNSQGWQWVFVEDAEKKKAIGEIYLANARGYLSSPSPGFRDLSRRAHPRSACADDPVHRRPRRQAADGRSGILGVTVPGGVELLPGAAVARARHLLDDAASDSWR